MARTSSLTELARAGFSELTRSRDDLAALDAAQLWPRADWLEFFSASADPDSSLRCVRDLLERAPEEAAAVILAVPQRLVRLLGASQALGDFFVRNPRELEWLTDPDVSPLPGSDYIASLLGSVEAQGGVAGLTGDPGWVALRIRYRRHVARLACYDLESSEPARAFDEVARALSDLAGAALEASLAVARASLADPTSLGQTFPREQVAAARLAIIAMGKAGARELNYVSDVDVIFVGEPDEAETVTTDRALLITTRLAAETMRGIYEYSREPGLWEVDPNLRPEGKDGALVRTLASHRAYYDRWAKGWEFQALLKARPIAGDSELGADYLAALSPLVWASGARENFVGSVQRMRERVTEHIPSEDVNYQIKLGPGGLRDVEFTVQLLQLVHGQADDTVRQRGTLPAIHALAEGGYIGRDDAAQFSAAYRLLRLLEHRLQLRHLARTALMPTAADDQRWLARASGLAPTAEGLVALWESTKYSVRSLHLKLFYRPLLEAAASADSIPVGDTTLTNDQAAARLAAIGFLDPRGALRHIAVLTSGVSRRATIQRALLPVLLHWFSEGSDPDYGLLAFRRISDTLGTTPWYLRLLRDSTAAAGRLTTVLSGSRFIGELMEKMPESVAWLEGDNRLRRLPTSVLNEEIDAILARHDSIDAAAVPIRHIRRREILRSAIASLVGVATARDTAQALSDINTAVLRGLLGAIRSHAAVSHGDGIEFAVIAMGRYGGTEMGFGSDLDLMYVFRPTHSGLDTGQAVAQFIVSELKRLTEDPSLPFDIDLGLRPEGKNGPVVRSLDSYRAYYERWSLTWEAQALLRARPVAGDTALRDDFMELADSVRYRDGVSDLELREIRRIKARIESERLPQGADPLRHLKLGRGSLSDVEWFVQLTQLVHAHDIPGLRTTSTLEALEVAAAYALVTEEDALLLRESWVLATQIRSALTLWLNKTSDVLPVDRAQLEGIARIVGLPAGSATDLEQLYLATTRRARAVFERDFYGEP
ncbi:bifunctional [glutamine synthetase] adenylyltransferase/[glutamine synthetase]-adenylyl-L-tyrosine phosphorylase [Klugiella xanthotipulae]|uniref:Glutamate-ammonia-ligase adenylyltransferase n=1 Tax=Klugiella xanthotipulae TaxID=244735 RepID=A0A543HS66_9MICO|nr:bifunctional [glutamine synthetase] adenylyltransferase/[glutamine synthetase]-adenylyl-L-tyrosine phosphorylase [Klugiella xanthotipulae]TQM61155.1 glutamate-ammonia-ligase adenylyltransferase [Klugiella xanthotipulae]